MEIKFDFLLPNYWGNLLRAGLVTARKKEQQAENNSWQLVFIH
jgi:hypothetical protein